LQDFSLHRIYYNDAKSNQMAGDFRYINLKIQDVRLLND